MTAQASPVEPADPALRAAERAFERGDFADAAHRARGLLDAADEATRSGAREMLGRFRNDRIVIALMAASLVLLLLVVARTLGH